MGRGEAILNEDTPQLWRRLSPLMDQVLALPAGQRLDFIERECAADSRLLERMRKWLAALATSGDFLEHAHTGSALDPGAQFQPLPQGEPVGVYRIERLLGRGGMGEVYLASRADGQFEQEVAIKLINAAFADEPEPFLAERRILARLEHPGITRLFDGGLTGDGRPYMVMERIEGQDLLAWCRERHATLEQRLRLFIQLCQALGYAHRRLIVHRDIKPNNVLVTREGTVKLLDFGIARLLGAPGLPESASLLRATPAYAAPEQLTGGDITAATDVYALGVLLYRLLTDRPPLALGDLPTPLAIERAINDKPDAPSMVATPDAPVPARRLRGDLDAIVLKCLHKDPLERYASAVGLEADLQRYLNHQPVIARGDAAGYVLGRFIRRHRLLASAAGLILAVTLGATVVVANYAHTVRMQRDAARSQSARLEDAEDYLFRLFKHAGDKPGGEPLTVKAMLDAERQRGEANPTASESVRMSRVLGHLYSSMDDDASGAAMLQAYLQNAPADTPPSELASARADLAQSLLRSGHPQEAQQQLQQAQAFWSGDAARYGRELLDSRTLQSQLLREHGDFPGGIALLQQAIDESIQTYGEEQLRTAYFYNDLANAEQQAGRMPEARDAARHAWTILTALHHEHSEQGLNALNNLAAMAYFQGDFAEAERRFHDAVDLRRDLFGPSAALAGLLNNYGKLMVKQGRPQEALPLLQEAVALSGRYSGPTSFLGIACQLSLAQAQIAIGPSAEAEAAAQSTLATAKGAFGDKHLITAAAQLALARLRYEQQRPAEGLVLLNTGQATAEALGPSAKGVLAEAEKLRKTYASGSSS